MIAEIRFANDAQWVKMEIDFKEFKIDKDFTHVAYGWYKGQYIVIKK